MDDTSEINRLAVELSDLEVALLLCLAVREHCRIDTASDNIHDVAKELALVLGPTELRPTAANGLLDMCQHI